MRPLLWLSLTAPRRCVPKFGHSSRRHSWKLRVELKSTPTVPSFCSHVHGRHDTVVPPTKRFTPSSTVRWKMLAGVNWAQPFKAWFRLPTFVYPPRHGVAIEQLAPG